VKCEVMFHPISQALLSDQFDSAFFSIGINYRLHVSGILNLDGPLFVNNSRQANAFYVFQKLGIILVRTGCTELYSQLCVLTNSEFDRVKAG